VSAPVDSPGFATCISDLGAVLANPIATISVPLGLVIGFESLPSRTTARQAGVMPKSVVVVGWNVGSGRTSHFPLRCQPGPASRVDGLNQPSNRLVHFIGLLALANCECLRLRSEKRSNGALYLLKQRVWSRDGNLIAGEDQLVRSR